MALPICHTKGAYAISDFTAAAERRWPKLPIGPVAPAVTSWTRNHYWWGCSPSRSAARPSCLPNTASTLPAACRQWPTLRQPLLLHLETVGVAGQYLSSGGCQPNPFSPEVEVRCNWPRKARILPAGRIGHRAPTFRLGGRRPRGVGVAPAARDRPRRQSRRKSAEFMGMK